MAVVATMTKIRDVEPTELAPLHYSIDTDALDEFVRAWAPTNGTVSTTFAFDAYAITVLSGGMVAASLPEYELGAGEPSGGAC